MLPSIVKRTHWRALSRALWHVYKSKLPDKRAPKRTPFTSNRVLVSELPIGQNTQVRELLYIWYRQIVLNHKLQQIELNGLSLG